MRLLKYILAIALLFPTPAFASTALPWLLNTALTGASPAMVNGVNPNIGIGTTSPFAKLSIAGSAGGTTPLFAISSSTAAFATSSVFTVDSSGNATFGAQAIFPKTSSGITLYNTADQTTNFEKGAFNWQSNILTIGTTNGGSGNIREMRIGVSATNGSSLLGRYLDLGNNSPNGRFYFTDSTASNIPTVGIVGTPSSSNGTQTTLFLGTNFAQSSTAGYSALTIQPIETSLGSGTHYLIQAGTSTAPNLFTVDNKGNTSITGSLALATSTPSPGIGVAIGTTSMSSAFSGFYTASSTCTGTCTPNWQTEGANGTGGNVIKYLLNQNLTLTINATSSNPLSGPVGLEFKQDAVGSRTLAIPDTQANVFDQGTPVLAGTANTCQSLLGVYHANWTGTLRNTGVFEWYGLSPAQPC